MTEEDLDVILKAYWGEEQFEEQRRFRFSFDEKYAYVCGIPLDAKLTPEAEAAIEKLGPA